MRARRQGGEGGREEKGEGRRRGKVEAHQINLMLIDVLYIYCTLYSIMYN